MDHYVLVTAHYDSLAQVRKPDTGVDQLIAEAVRQGVDQSEARRYRTILPPEREDGPLDFEATAAQTIAPGITDDGSGTAGVMELARVMSGYQFDKTIVFIAFAGEEVGLSGSQFYATQAKNQDGMRIEAGVNDDIIGSDVSGNGRWRPTYCVFSASPDDSAPRELAGAGYQADCRALRSIHAGQMVFRGDRFLRGGDHPALRQSGFRRGAPHQREREVREPAHHHRHIREYFGSLRHARDCMNAAVAATLALAARPLRCSTGPGCPGRTRAARASADAR